MIYSNCKQVTGPLRRPTSMQRLSRGSVICFGSTIDFEFCVDTVFVVASAERWIPGHTQEPEVDDAFRACTLNALAAGGEFARTQFTLYRGATIDDPVNGMFSFVPARPADARDRRFARPSIQSEFIKPSSRQSTWGSKRALPLDAIRKAWDSVREQVLAADLLLGVALQTPESRDVRGSSTAEGALVLN